MVRLVVARNATCEAGTPDSASHVASMLDDGLLIVISWLPTLNPQRTWGGLMTG